MKCPSLWNPKYHCQPEIVWFGLCYCQRLQFTRRSNVTCLLKSVLFPYRKFTCVSHVIHMWSSKNTCESRNPCVSHVTCFSHVEFHMWKFTCEISHVKFHMWNFTWDFLHVKYHIWHVNYLWNFTCEISHVNFHMWHVTFHMWFFTCGISHLKFHMREATCITAQKKSLMWNFTRERSHGKIQLIWLGSRQQLLNVNPDSILLGATTVRFQSSVVDLGVVLDSNLSMRDHVSRLCRTSYYQLRQLRVIRRSLTTRACTQLVHALVNSRLNYCNSLLSGITDQLLSQLQSVLRASARLVLQRRKFDPISNNIREKLHWLPIQQRIIYKLCLFVFRCLRGEAPAYLCEMLTPLSGVHLLRLLRSAAHGNLHIPRTRTRTFGPRSFSVSGPSSWNKLPDNLKNIELTLQVFKSQLKTHLFHQAYGQ